MLHEANPAYREGTTIINVYEQLKAIPVGETRVVEVSDSFTGEIISHARVRMFASRVCSDQGMKVKTRVYGGSLHVMRTA